MKIRTSQHGLDLLVLIAACAGTITSALALHEDDAESEVRPLRRASRAGPLRRLLRRIEHEAAAGAATGFWAPKVAAEPEPMAARSEEDFPVSIGVGGTNIPTPKKGEASVPTPPGPGGTGAAAPAKPPKKKEPEPVARVLVFGDEWAHGAGDEGLLESMFAKEYLTVDVKHYRMAGLHASVYPADELVKGIKTMFKEEVPQFVWLTLGEFDYQAPNFAGCAAKTEEEAAQCVAKFTKSYINHYIDAMLLAMWGHEKYKDVKVMQCGYDLPCEDGLCGLSWYKSDPFCGSDRACRRRMMMKWNHFLLDPEYHHLDNHSFKYTGINVMGALQSFALQIGVRPGKPDMRRGSPCKDFAAGSCISPKVGTPGYHNIGQAFWEMYFSEFLSSGKYEPPWAANDALDGWWGG